MRMFPLLLLAVFLMSAGWRTDYSKAKEDAVKEHKFILLKFSGSDWCIPCIKMEKGLFGQERFTQYADSNLVMVNADFPRQKKNQLPAGTIKQNEQLAEQYDKEGHFPFTVLLDSDGKVLKRWDGNPGLSPDEFIREIENVKNAR